MNWIRMKLARRRLNKLGVEGLHFVEYDKLVSVWTAYGYPREWVACDFCGATSWMFPPHGEGESCPIPVGMAEATGQRLDAEAATTRRMGLHMEQVTRRINEMFGEEESE